MTVFGDRAFTEAITIKQGSAGRALSSRASILTIGSDVLTSLLCTHRVRAVLSL